MTFYVEEEAEVTLPFERDVLVKQVIKAALQSEKCPFEAEVHILLTDNAGIRKLNREFRNIDKETDVLSFPNVDYERPADYSLIHEREADYLNPDTGELMLGDIVLSMERVFSQAEEYGHSVKREFAFLIAHSMLHLLGYDHMEPLAAAEMEEKQEALLETLQITRE